ncbi:MAG TPA: TIGR03557 family F420-dependent LLM class oxidoreductase [Acidimicrobiales bacterium]|nr:TIGR03557 family F420-dependent LLM class oxidoreductase [Acidimicrobiales bacterium]
MTLWGYTMMCEQSDPCSLVDDVVRAEAVGFDFAVISDHYFPWLDSQGHSPYAWSVLGAAAQATSSIPLMTYVTCPSFRYHPAVVAQKAATVQLLSGGRFTLGLGSGENLNEHVIGQGWPNSRVRHERLREAIDVIRALFAGGFVDYRGDHFDVNRAKLWDLPSPVPPIGVAVSGPRSARLAGDKADLMIAVQPEPTLGEMFDRAGGVGKPRVGQMAVSFDTDAQAAVERAHDQFRWFASGWHVMSELPSTTAFAAASAQVSAEDVRAQIACGPDVEEHVGKLQAFVDAGFSHVALVQIGGGHQAPFLEWAGRELLPALRS